MRKYRINELMEEYSIKKHQFALKKIPQVLNISANTFHNYRRIELGDMQDIPHEKVILLEKLFEIEAGTLINDKPKTVTLDELYDEFKKI